MSEKEPRNPNLYDNCSHCEEDYDLTPNNTALRKFNKQPECNYLYTICTHCTGQTQIFCGLDTTEAIVEAGIPFVEDDYPDQEEYKKWLEIMEIKLIEPQEVTSRQERFIGYFRYLLEHNLIDIVKDKFI